MVVNDRRLVWKVRRAKLRNHAKLTSVFLPALLTGIFLMSMIWSNPVLGIFILFPIGAILALCSGLILWQVYSSRCDAIFDRERDHRKGLGGGYSIGTPLHPFSTAHRNSAEAQKAITGRPRSGNLNDIYAVQVISKLVNAQIAPESSYGKTRERRLVANADEWNTPVRSKMPTKNIQTYELNIVLKSGIRVNIIDHNDVAVIREEASTLATFLTVPVWDDSDRGFWRFLLSEKLSPKMFWLWTIRRAAPGAWLFLPGKVRWGITAKDTQWELGYAYLMDYVEVKGHARVHESDQSDDYFFGPFPLGKWVARQRAEMETLSADQRNRLEMLAGWATNDQSSFCLSVTDSCARCYDASRQPSTCGGKVLDPQARRVKKLSRTLNAFKSRGLQRLKFSHLSRLILHQSVPMLCGFHRSLTASPSQRRSHTDRRFLDHVRLG